MLHGVWYHRGCWHPREYSIFGTFAHICVQNLAAAAVAAACVFMFCSSMRCCFFLCNPFDGLEKDPIQC